MMKPSLLRSSLVRNMFLLAGLSLSGALAFASFREAARQPILPESTTLSLRKDVAHKPIEQIRVGERVVTDLPAEARDLHGMGPAKSAERNPAQSPDKFRLIRMRGERIWQDGTVDDLNVETIQHVSWIETNKVRVGKPAAIPLDLVEMGESADQQAIVLAVLPCPKIEEGPGQVVLTTVNHLSPRILSLSVRNKEGALETISSTPFHKFYNSTRRLWMSADDLRIGDTLDGSTGPCSAIGFEETLKTTRVYNLSVEDEHVYRVSNLGILVHNICFEMDINPGVGMRRISGPMTVAEAVEVARRMGDISTPSRTTAIDIAMRVSPIGRMEEDLAQVLRNGVTIPGHVHPLDANGVRMPVHIYYPD